MDTRIPEEPTLTRDILFYVAERAGSGVAITLEDFERAFRGAAYGELRYHLGIAFGLDLLDAEDCLRREVRRAGGEGAWIDVLNIRVSGLTDRGQEYVRQAQTPQWRRACERLKRGGTPATTQQLMRALKDGSQGTARRAAAFRPSALRASSKDSAAPQSEATFLCYACRRVRPSIAGTM